MSEGIVVTSKTQIIIVEPASGSVSVISSGPAGPAGPEGPPGSGGGSGFPLIENDGTYGYSIDIPSSGTMRETVRDNATGSYFATRRYYSDGTNSALVADAVESVTGEFTQILVASDSMNQSRLIWNSSDSPSQCNVNLGSGDPNGLVGSPKGSLFVDMTTPALWQCTTPFSWVEIGAGGGGSAEFPIIYYDGTNTYTISADDAAGGHDGEMALVVTDGTASSHVDIGATYLDLRADGGGCTISSVGLLFLNSAGAGNDIQISSAHDIGHLAANRIDMSGLTVQFTGTHIWFTPEPSGASGKISFDGGSHEAHTPVNVTGSRAGNAALASLLTALTSVGIISNSTSA